MIICNQRFEFGTGNRGQRPHFLHMINSAEHIIPLVRQVLNIQQSLVTLLLSTLLSQTCEFAAELVNCST